MSDRAQSSNQHLWLRRIATRHPKLVYVSMRLAGSVMSLLPRRAVFVSLVWMEALGLPLQRMCALSYQPYVLSYLVKNPKWCFASSLSRPFVKASALVLYRIGAYEEAREWIAGSGRTIVSAELNRTLAQIQFDRGDFADASDTMNAITYALTLDANPEGATLKAMLDLISGNEQSAIESFDRARRSVPYLRRPHQNIAARLPFEYESNPIDEAAGPAGSMFDLSNFTGQRVTHVGRGDLGASLFGHALAAQKELRSQPFPSVSPSLSRILRRLGIDFSELRIVPVEWTTQIGHLGMLDVLFRMKDLGWWGGKPVFVFNPTVVANAQFLRLFEQFGPTLTIGGNISKQIGEELLSLQRWYGLNFNAFELPDGRIVPWQEAGALAMRQWEDEKRPSPMRKEFDRIFGQSHQTHNSFAAIRNYWGMKEEDWFVCLHVREPSHYLELAGTGQTHRNAELETYLEAIRHITQKGGWVIKLGGKTSPKLPPMKRVVDYAASPFKSELMDLCLIRHAKLFIGTTSGLTNVAISFGIPSALVNCITTDAQLWNSGVRFAVKPVMGPNGMLTQRQITSTPWRWRLFDAAVLGRSGGRLLNNSSDEILETVKEVEAYAEGASAAYEAGFETERLLGAWATELSLPYFYGYARPSLHFLKKHEHHFLAQGDKTVDVGVRPR